MCYLMFNILVFQCVRRQIRADTHTYIQTHTHSTATVMLAAVPRVNYSYILSIKRRKPLNNGHFPIMKKITAPNSVHLRGVPL